MLHESDFRVWAPRNCRSAQYSSSLNLLLLSRGRVDAAAGDFLSVRPVLVSLDARLPLDAVPVVGGVVYHPEIFGGTQMELLPINDAKGALLDARRNLRSDDVGSESRGGSGDDGNGGESGEDADHESLLLKLRNECGTEHPKNVQIRRFSDAPTLPLHHLANSL